MSRSCSVRGCYRQAWNRGMCVMYYFRWRRHGLQPQASRRVRGRPRTNVGACSVDACESLAVKRGWCDKHYERWRQHGDPSFTLPDKGQFET